MFFGREVSHVLDLFSATPQDIQRLIDSESDPVILRHLVDIQVAIEADALDAHVDAVGALCDLLVMERGA
jgi:hypothetical protein